MACHSSHKHSTLFQQQKLIPFMTKLWHLGISLSLAPGTYPYILLLTFPDLGGSGCPQKVLYTVIALTFEWSSLLSLAYSFFYRFLFLLIWLPASGTVELFPKLDLQQFNSSNPFITRVIFFTCFELQHLLAAAIKFKGEQRHVAFFCFQKSRVVTVRVIGL